MSLPTPNNIEEWILKKIDCTHTKVAGDGHHFQALIVSEAFRGLRTIKRHQLVYQALGDKMAGEIHALSMRTLTPDEWDG